MNDYKGNIKKAALSKTKYSEKKSAITKSINSNKEKSTELKKIRTLEKNNMAEVIQNVESYHKIYTDLEVIISGINRTNGKFRIPKIKDVINKHIPANVRNKLLSIKELKDSLAKLAEMADIDIYKAKDKIIVAAKNKIYNDILDKAAKIYKKVYFHAGNSYIKRALSETEIAKLLRKEDSLEKLKLFEKKLDTVAKVFSKVDKVINMSDRAIKILDIYAGGGRLLDQSNRLNTSEDFKNYYYKVAQEASQTASILKSFSSKLPPGMRDYYEFIFTVAESTDKMAKVVYDYTTKLENAMKELDKDSKSMGEKNSAFNDGGVPSDVTKYPNDPSNIYLR